MLRNGLPRGRGLLPSRRRATPEIKQKRWPRLEQNRSQSAQRSYEHYIAIARSATVNGNTIEAENYYQNTSEESAASGSEGS